MIPVSEPLLDGNEKRYLAECIDSGWVSSEGPFVSRFEQAFSLFLPAGTRVPSAACRFQNNHAACGSGEGKIARHRMVWIDRGTG